MASMVRSSLHLCGRGVVADKQDGVAIAKESISHWCGQGKRLPEAVAGLQRNKNTVESIFGVPCTMGANTAGR